MSSVLEHAASVDHRDIRDRCAVVGVGHSRLGKVPGVSSLDLSIEAMKNAIDDSGVKLSEMRAQPSAQRGVVFEQENFAAGGERSFVGHRSL